MRLSADVPVNRWDEFVVTACYLRNRVPTKALDKMTPFEAFYGKKPDVSHLREIGSKAFVLILNKHNPKVYARSEECVLIGYGKDSKTYCVYHRPTHRVLESYHIVFVESRDAREKAFRPGVITSSDEEEVIALPGPTLKAIPPPINIPLPTTTPISLVSPPPSPGFSAHDTPASTVAASLICPPVQESRRSSRLPLPSEKRAMASDITRLSAVARATEESRAAGDRKRESRARSASRVRASTPTVHPRTRSHSRGRSSTPKSQIPAPSPSAHASRVPSIPEEEIANFLASLPADVRSSLQDDSPLGPDCFGEGDEIDPDDPQSFDEAMARSDAAKWVEAIKDELKSITELEVWSLVPRSIPKSEGRKILKGRFVFHLKRDENGVIVRWKVRFVVKGFAAVKDVDYKKTTSPTMRLESYHVVVHVAAAMGWAIHQVDIKTAFLRGRLPKGEHVYMEQPIGFEVPGKEDWVLKVVKGLYGLPNAGRVWYQEMTDVMLNLGYTRIPCEHCIFVRFSDVGKIIACVHVDDYLAAVSNDDVARRFKEELRSVWEISDLGIATFCLGIAIERDLAASHVYLSQTALIDKTLALFKMSDCKPVSTPMETTISTIT